MPFILQLTAISNSKESNVTSRTLSLCPGGGLMFWNRSIRVTLQVMLMKSRYAFATASEAVPKYQLNKHLNRLIRVNHSMMLSFMQVPVRRLVMLSQVQLW